MSEKRDFGYAEIQTLLVMALTILLTAAVYPYGLFDLTVWLTIVFLFLAAYGITGLWRCLQAALRGLSARDLFPGLVEDRVLVGFTAIACAYVLTIFQVMVLTQFIEFVLFVLAGLGLLWAVSRR